jgi:hypothetical protein
VVQPGDQSLADRLVDVPGVLGQPVPRPILVGGVVPVLLAHGEHLGGLAERTGGQQMREGGQQQPAGEVAGTAEHDQGTPHRRASSARARAQPLEMTPT